MAKIAVAPLVGAWIEIDPTLIKPKRRFVAPLVGAWIEIISHNGFTLLNKSLPSWERGLKCVSYGFAAKDAPGRSPRGSVD